MFVAWTTVSTREEAERLATGVIENAFAACVQIEGPIVSHFKWDGKIRRTEELRLTFKCLSDQLLTLERYVLAQHPYSTPEWIVVRAEHVSEKYLSWARGDVQSSPL